MSKSIKIKSRLMVIRNRRNRGIGNNHSLDVEFYFVVIKMFWNERWWLHSIVYILAAVEVLTFKWLILCEFYLNFLMKKISLIPKDKVEGTRVGILSLRFGERFLGLFLSKLTGQKCWQFTQSQQVSLF